MFLKLTHINLFHHILNAPTCCALPFHNETFSSNAALFHKKQTMSVKTRFPTALHQLNGMQRKNAFPSHGSLPLQSPYLPPPVRKKKKKKWSGDFILKKQEVRPLVHLGQLLDGGGKLEGYRSLGMFNIKKAIRM